MNNLQKISFLIAAHNEEKIIERTIKNLLRIPYKNYEIILGLDGCTDKTEAIVKRYSNQNSKLKYFVLNLRQGKPAVINKIIKKASGSIIIINDADWLFHVSSRVALNKMLLAFNNPKIGGIAESFPVQYPLREKASFLERGIMIQNKLWIDYIKGAGEKLDKDWIIADKNSHPLLVNIFRKNLYKPNKTLGDDFERFKDITRANKIVLATNNIELPRMITLGEKYKFRELIVQKERTALARKQLAEKPNARSLNSINFFIYVLKKTLLMNPKNAISFFLVNLAFILGTLKSKLRKKVSTKEGWKMRLTR
jgi:glycosyltransferase involved in cell wall biosynthesis